MGLNTLLSFTVFVIGCVLIAIILINHTQTAARLLCLSLFALTYSIFLIFWFDSQYILHTPFLFRTGGIAGYLIVPSFYLYVICMLHDRRKLKWWDAIHLLPALFYIVDYTPFWLSGSENKRAVLLDLFQHQQNVLLFREGWLVPSGIHNVARNGISLIYFFFIGRLLFNPVYYQTFHVERKVLDWLRISATMYFLLTVAGIMTITILPSPNAWPFTVLTILAIFLVMSLILFLEPNILYGEEQLKLELNHDKNKPPNFAPHLMEQTGTRLRNFIRSQHYLNKNLKLDEVAHELGVKPYVLSAFINQEYQMHFNDLINHYRIQHIKEGIMNNEWKDLTLEAIAEKAGFSNRNTFLSAFKKSTGMTPTSFMRMHRGDHFKKPQSEEEGN